MEEKERVDIESYRKRIGFKLFEKLFEGIDF